MARTFTVSRTDTGIGFLCFDLVMSTTPPASSEADALPGPSGTSVSVETISAADARVIAGELATISRSLSVTGVSPLCSGFSAEATGEGASNEERPSDQQ